MKNDEKEQWYDKHNIKEQSNWHKTVQKDFLALEVFVDLEEAYFVIFVVQNNHYEMDRNH